MQVNSNGLLSFLTEIPSFFNIQFPLDYPVIAPLYTNVDTRGSGAVYYRYLYLTISKRKYICHTLDAFKSRARNVCNKFCDMCHPLSCNFQAFFVKSKQIYMLLTLSAHNASAVSLRSECAICLCVYFLVRIN
jgi:hypothetical protein